MHILVTGGKGMLGSDVVSVLQDRGLVVTGADREVCDITNLEEVRAVFEEVEPTHVINCAAWTDVDGAEREHEECYAVNVRGVMHLASLAKERGSKLIHTSTDYVFSGQEESYAEDAARQPINYYGTTKAEAEQHIEEHLSDYCIVRTSWLYGRHGKNFVNTIIDAARMRNRLDVVDDQIGAPTYTRDLAAGIVELLDMESGVYHITNGGSCSWYTFANKIVAEIGATCEVYPCSTEAYPRPAERPLYSVLTNTKLPPLRSWEEALADYIHNDLTI